MKKKVAIIIERTEITLGGAERSVFELTAALSNLGIEVDILAAKGKTNTKHIHILCSKDPGKRTSFSTFSKALKEFLSKNKYDIVHSVLPFEFADIYQPRGGSFAEATLRNAVSYQNSLLQSYKKMTSFMNFRRASFLQAERRLCRNPSGPIVAVLSEYVARQFKKHYNLNEERIKIILNGIKINKKNHPAEADKLRTQILTTLGIKEADEPVFFLFVANNFRLKGLQCLIKAMRTAANYKTEKQSYLIVAGNGKAGKYRKLAKKIGIQEKIIFLGAVRHIQDALSITDAAILPTYYDPSSRYILEALAADKPVITTKYNGATDLFTKDRHGKVVDTPENTDELAKAIVYFTNAGNSKKFTKNIISDNLKEQLSIDRVSRQMEQLYNQILEKRGHK